MLFDEQAQFLHQPATIGVLFEVLRDLPGEVVAGQARSDVADKSLALLPGGEGLGEVVVAGAEHQIHDEALLIRVGQTALELPQKLRVRFVSGLERMGDWFIPNGEQRPDMVELLGGARVDDALEQRAIQVGEAQQRIAHPQMRLEPFGIPPVMHVGGLNKRQRCRFRSLHRAGLILETGQIAG